MVILINFPFMSIVLFFTPNAQRDSMRQTHNLNSHLVVGNNEIFYTLYWETITNSERYNRFILTFKYKHEHAQNFQWCSFKVMIFLPCKLWWIQDKGWRASDFGCLGTQSPGGRKVSWSLTPYSYWQVAEGWQILGMLNMGLHESFQFLRLEML